MDLLGRISEWLNSHRRSQDDPAGQNPANRDSLLRLTLSLGRRYVDLAIGQSAGADQAPRMPPATEARRPPHPGTSDETYASSASRHSLPQQETTTSPDHRLQAPGASFWDVLDPTEREALRSVASWRTFAAGARLMEEGEQADHVMVILGGRVKVCTHENGNERMLAIHGRGQLVGERGALQVSVRSATVIALDMIWALVVQTKDFAAFVSAHPRVLDIVQRQLYQRHTEDLAGHGDDDNASAFLAGTASSAAIAGPQGPGYIAGGWQRRPQTLTGENCTVFLTDVVGFGARTRTDSDRLLIREALFKMTQVTIQGLPGAQSEDRGDGFLTVVPPNVSTAKVLDRLLKEMPAALELHNITQRESARFKLRLAMNVGPVVSDMGVSGEAIIVVARLLEAPRFKEAIAENTASLGLIVSPFVYETVIRHGADLRDVASYSQVPVEVKESDTIAWMKLFDALVSSPIIPRPTAPESYLLIRQQQPLCVAESR
jgi:CRP-like cAMP-binding protein